MMRKPFKALISAMSMAAFLFNVFSADLVWAVAIHQFERDAVSLKRLDVDTFDLPEYLGHIKAIWSPEKRETGKPVNRQTVIHIQDAHCNYAAQRKIAEVIEYLNMEYGVETVNLEGGVGEYDLSVFSDIKDVPKREIMADYFVKEGLVNGAEYYAITNPGKIALWGVEDTQLYMDDLRAYLDSRDNKDEVDRCIKTLSGILAALKKKIYSPELLEFDANCSRYIAGSLDLKAYLAELVDKAKVKAIDIKLFRNICILSETLAREGAVDFDKANNERDSLIGTLRKALSRNELSELVSRISGFKQGKLTPNDFYSYMILKAGSVNIDLNKFPDLVRYAAYVSAYDAIDEIEVMDEIAKLEGIIRDALSRNDDEKELNKLSRNLTLIEDMFSLRLSAHDYGYYTENERSFAVKNYAAFIGRIAPGDHIASDLAGVEGLDKHLESMVRFFEYSFKRDRAFTENIKTGRASGQVTVLITGGFHAENLGHIFKGRGIAYISIM
ncbi:MAG: hypothetical protein HQL30_12385, partial [Candidatus Omnitrophica bacterium]|nr:hypothetical protein [Candidatus Omnitrophota bacterium]